MQINFGNGLIAGISVRDAAGENIFQSQGKGDVEIQINFQPDMELVKMIQSRYEEPYSEVVLLSLHKVKVMEILMLNSK